MHNSQSSKSRSVFELYRTQCRAVLFLIKTKEDWIVCTNLRWQECTYLHRVKKGEYNVNLDKTQPKDYVVIKKVLSNCFSITSIVISSLLKECHEPFPGEKKAPVKNSSTPVYVTSIALGVCVNLASNRLLTTLSITAVKLSSDDIITLSKGLKENKSITNFAFNSISVIPKIFHKLAYSIANHPTLEIVELVNDHLTDQYTSSIKMIIMCQNNKRDTQLWMGGLRGCKVDPSTIHSMVKFNLSKNCLGNIFANSISDIMKNDNLLKSLNLSDNNIGADGIKRLTSVLKYNQLLLALDIRGNPGYSDELFHKIATGLLANITNACKSHAKRAEIIEKELIDRTLLSVELSENVLNSIMSPPASIPNSASADTKSKSSENSSKMQSKPTTEGAITNLSSNRKERSISSEKFIRHRRTDSITTPLPFSKTANHSPKSSNAQNVRLFSKRLSLPCELNDQCKCCKLLQKRVFLAESNALRYKMNMNLLKMKSPIQGSKMKVRLYKAPTAVAGEENYQAVREKIDSMMKEMVDLMKILETNTR